MLTEQNHDEYDHSEHDCNKKLKHRRYNASLICIILTIPTMGVSIIFFRSLALEKSTYFLNNDSKAVYCEINNILRNDCVYQESLDMKIYGSIYEFQYVFNNNVCANYSYCLPKNYTMNNSSTTKNCVIIPDINICSIDMLLVNIRPLFISFLVFLPIYLISIGYLIYLNYKYIKI